VGYRELAGVDYLSALGEENRRFIVVAQDAGYSTRVPTCPEWNIGDLVFHLGRVQRWFLGMLSTNGADPKSLPKTVRPSDDGDLAAWFTSGAVEIESYLHSLSDDQPAWTFTGGDVGKWPKRRQAQEVLVHRFDAELAGGKVSLANIELCADGIDELLTVFLPRLGDKAVLSQSVHLHCTDTDGEWMLTPSTTGIEVSREHGKSAVALRASAQALLQVVWRRQSVDSALAGGAEVFGDRAALDAFLEITRF